MFRIMYTLIFWTVPCFKSQPVKPKTEGMIPALEMLAPISLKKIIKSLFGVSTDLSDADKPKMCQLVLPEKKKTHNHRLTLTLAKGATEMNAVLTIGLDSEC